MGNEETNLCFKTVMYNVVFLFYVTRMTQMGDILDMISNDRIL